MVREAVAMEGMGPMLGKERAGVLWRRVAALPRQLHSLEAPSLF